MEDRYLIGYKKGFSNGIKQCIEMFKQLFYERNINIKESDYFLELSEIEDALNTIEISEGD